MHDGNPGIAKKTCCSSSTRIYKTVIKAFSIPKNYNHSRYCMYPQRGLRYNWKDWM